MLERRNPSSVTGIARVQRRDRRGVAWLDADEPGRAIGVGVDRLGRVDQFAVDAGDLAIDGREEVAHRFDALYDAEGLACLERRASFRQTLPISRSRFRTPASRV